MMESSVSRSREESTSIVMQEQALAPLESTPPTRGVSSPASVNALDDSFDENDTDEQRKKKKKEKKEKKVKKDSKKSKSSSRRSSDERRSSRSSSALDEPPIEEGHEVKAEDAPRRDETPPPRAEQPQPPPPSVMDPEMQSPSGVCQIRRHSPVITSSIAPIHEWAVGRESIVLPAVLATGMIKHTNSMKPVPATTSKILRTSVGGDDIAPSYNMRSMRSLKLDDNGLQRARSDSMDRASSKHLGKEFLTTPPPLRLDAWTEPPGTTFSVRGPNYMRNSKKAQSTPSVFRLLTVDLVKVDKPLLTGICSHPNERIQRALAREQETGLRELPVFIFAVNLVIPTSATLYHKVFYFGCDDMDTITDTSTPFGNLANQFFFGESDAFRNTTFKLIPRIVEGNFIVRKAVGSKPAILGKKIKQTYIRTNRFMELISDIASDNVAAKIVNLSIGYAKTLSVDMAFVLEGNDGSTLPEQVLGAVRMNKLDFKKRDGQRRLAPS